MKTLPKMTASEFSIPVGNECRFGSSAEADYKAGERNCFCSQMRLMLLTARDKTQAPYWCGFDDIANVKIAFPLFIEDDERNRKEFISGTPLEENSYIRRNDNIYIICLDPELGYVVRQIAVYASTLEASAFQLSSKTPQYERTEYELVQLTKVNEPNQLLCIAWHTIRDSKYNFLPVFIEDNEKYKAIEKNSLNWSPLKANDTFWHDNRLYRVCKDNCDELYIAQTPMQVYIPKH